jgi:hypothetical protein
MPEMPLDHPERATGCRSSVLRTRGTAARRAAPRPSPGR